MRSTQPKALRNLALLATCGAALVLLASPALASPRHTLRVQVNSAVILPDGQIAPPGALILSLDRDLTPVRGLHRIEASGYVVEFAASRRARHELEGIAEPFALFHRDGHGLLRLIGYAWSDGRNAQAYLLAHDTPLEPFLAEMGRGSRAPESDRAVVVAVTAPGR